MAHTTTREQKTRMLCTAGLMAALACVSNFISIATPASRIHIGNAVCVLCGLILGPAYGFFAASSCTYRSMRSQASPICS